MLPFCMYAEKDYCRQGGREGGRAGGREKGCVGWKGCENLRRYRRRMVRHCNGWIEGKEQEGKGGQGGRQKEWSKN